jgi:hypothetical protein
MPYCYARKWTSFSGLKIHHSLDFDFTCLHPPRLCTCTDLKTWPLSTRTMRQPLIRLDQRHRETQSLDTLNVLPRRHHQLLPRCSAYIQSHHYAGISLSSSCCLSHRSSPMRGTLFAITQAATSRPMIPPVQPLEALVVRKTGIACRMACAIRRKSTTSVTRVQIRTGRTQDALIYALLVSHFF